ncbi:MAG: 23S rRNA (guanosine(2251)-2'-O)-methyltransferase RlmB [Synergistaceae bacterium]|nr:23S rRNA (guanosine(2251)-2'-O)-methyltransferase RlmB [Synergistaceae bacterium]
MKNKREYKTTAPEIEKEREESELCWGRKPVLELLERTPERCLRVSMIKTGQHGALDKIIELCKAAHVPFQFLDTVALDRLCEGENHQGVVAMTSETPMLDLAEALALIPPQPERVLAVVLDHIQDPHNLGAIIRSAEAAGALFVAIPKRRSALPMGTVMKTSAGASARLPIVSVGNVAQTILAFQEAGLWSVGLDADTRESVFNGDLPSRLLLVIGAEGDGLGHATAKACDELRRIPMQGKGSSLNASVAAGIALFEWGRTHHHRKI